MSVCWSLVCDDLREKLWCGQNEYLYIEESEIMRDLGAFLYRCRGHDLRVVQDIEWDKSDDYLEVGDLERDGLDGWEITAVHHETGDRKYFGVYGGSRRQALNRAAGHRFPGVKYNDITNVLHNKYRLVTLTGVPEDAKQDLRHQTEG
jgi:hypothetical protein